jgi:hypothetical protein
MALDEEWLTENQQIFTDASQSEADRDAAGV